MGQILLLMDDAFAQLRLCTFLLPPPPNFAKIHAKVGRGRLGVALRDLIPPWGVHPVCRGGLPGFGAVPGRRPARGRGLCRAGPAGAGGGVPGQRGAPGTGAVSGAAGAAFPREAAEKLFSKGPSRMY